MTQCSYRSIAKISNILFAALLITACAGSPKKPIPEVTENAYKNLQAGVSNYDRSRYEQAQSNFITALNLFRSIDHSEGTASSCLNIAKVHLERNELSLARDYLTIAEALITESDISSLEDYLSITRSSLAIAENDLAAAKALLEPLIKAEKKSDIRLAALQNRIRVAFAEDDIATARDNVTIFSTSLSDHKDTTYKARLHRFQAALDADRSASDAKYQTALDIYRRHAHKPGIASTLHEWGDRLIDDKEFVRAEDRLLRALFVRQSMEDETGCTRLLMSLNKLYIKQDDEIEANKTVRWINRLSTAKFNQWDRFTDTFNTYPAR